jgi:anti-anti-sigma regulatory factor
MPEETPIEGRLVLSGEVTIQSAASIHSKLLEMAGQPVVEIDCDGVTETDLSLIQLILAADALRDALQRGGFLGAVAGRPNPDQAFWTQTAAT